MQYKALRMIADGMEYERAMGNGWGYFSSLSQVEYFKELFLLKAGGFGPKLGFKN